jgi:hypothetical protein
MKAYFWVDGGIEPRILTLVLDGDEWSASRPDRFAPGERAYIETWMYIDSVWVWNVDSRWGKNTNYKCLMMKRSGKYLDHIRMK